MQVGPPQHGDVRVRCDVRLQTPTKGSCLRPGAGRLMQDLPAFPRLIEPSAAPQHVGEHRARLARRRTTLAVVAVDGGRGCARSATKPTRPSHRFLAIDHGSDVRARGPFSGSRQGRRGCSSAPCAPRTSAQMGYTERAAIGCSAAVGQGSNAVGTAENNPCAAIEKAVGVVAAAVGNIDETRPAAEVAVEAAKALGEANADGRRRWEALARSPVNLRQIWWTGRTRSNGSLVASCPRKPFGLLCAGRRQHGRVTPVRSREAGWRDEVLHAERLRPPGR